MRRNMWCVDQVCSLGDLLVCNSVHVDYAPDDILKTVCDQSPAVKAVVPLLQVCGQIVQVAETSI